MLGYPATDWYAEYFRSSHVHSADREKPMRWDHPMRISDGNDQMEYRMIAADGRIAWLRDVTRIMQKSRGSREMPAS